MIRLRSLLISLLITVGGGWIISALIRGNMGVYSTIILPEFAPPMAIFSIVWVILYTLMGISACMVYESDSEIRPQALTAYGLQLILNFIWPLVFFNAHAFLPAFIIIMLIWILALVMIVLFYKIRSSAAYLQIPYILWLTFAAYLNLSIYLLNR